MTDDPMALTHDLAFVGLTGIIDPLRAEAKSAVTTALAAGIDVRMITGDHAVTAQAIGEELGLGPGAISGAELQALTDDELKAAAAPAARVRPGDAGGQAAAGARHAGAGPDRRHDRRRGQRRRRPQAGRHRGRDGQRQRGHQAGRPDGADRRQLRHPRPRRRDRPSGLRQDRVVRALPDDPAALPGAALPRRDDLRRQPGRGDDAVDGAVPAVLRDGRRRRHHRRRPRATPTSCTGRRATRPCRSRTGRPWSMWLVYAVVLFVGGAGAARGRPRRAAALEHAPASR